jgi:PAS domain-containing protein
MVLDAGGWAVDYRFLEVNPRLETMTGLADAAERAAFELVPNLEPRRVETYARVALGGEPLRFEQGSEAMGRWFDVFAIPVEPRGRFAVVF